MLTTVTRTSQGTLESTSTIRIRMPSTMPPTRPATVPTAMPTSTLVSIARMPTVRETRPP